MKKVSVLGEKKNITLFNTELEFIEDEVWLTNLLELADLVTENYDVSLVSFIFKKLGSIGVYDIKPCAYDQGFLNSLCICVNAINNKGTAICWF